jgi:iron complex transport system permease protein
MKSGSILILLILIIPALMLISLRSGAMPVTFSDILNLFSEADHLVSYVFLHIRLPRVVFAMMAGAGMAVSGAAMQGLFRNPLADPGLMGISSGAALAAALYLISGISLGGILQSLGMVIVPALGAALCTLLVVALAIDKGVTDVKILLLAGLVVNALCGAATAGLIFVANDEQLRTITFWMMGSTAQAGWVAVLSLLCTTLPAILLFIRLALPLNMLSLGDAQAAASGLHVEHVKGKIILLTAFTMGPIVAWSGMIGFVGLMVPHLLRQWLGADHRILLPASALGGSILMLAADTLARTIVLPAELPVGILTALCGGPLFLWILYKSKKLLQYA